jgi:glycosyltransferase involved in cell wall biosynthesis
VDVARVPASRAGIELTRVCIVALSHVPIDPRPRRHADLLHEHGLDVTVVGYPGAATAAHDWRYVTVPAPTWSLPKKAAEALRLAPGRVSSSAARRLHSTPGHLRELADAVESVEADAYVTHDYAALPAVARAARVRGGWYGYDCREFYAGQYADRLLWRLLAPPTVRAVEGELAAGARWVTTISDGLADLLSRQYDLAGRPTVVRSTPLLVEPPDHELGSTWTALFHGSLSPDRNVHGLIESVVHWPAHVRLEVRGGGAPGYVERLRQLVRRLDLEDRVRLTPAVPFADVVTAAAGADLGIIPWPLDKPQKRISLPNKLFEYLMAGLAVVATGPSEASRLVERHGAGRGYGPATPRALADAVHGLDRAALLAMRAGARTARTELCWENESRVLWRLWERSLQG